LIICCKILDMAVHWASVGAVMVCVLSTDSSSIVGYFSDEWCSKGYGQEFVYINTWSCSAQWSSRNRKTTTRTSVLEVFRDASREFPAQKPQLLKKHAILRVSHHKSLGWDNNDRLVLRRACRSVPMFLLYYTDMRNIVVSSATLDVDSFRANNFCRITKRLLKAHRLSTEEVILTLGKEDSNAFEAAHHIVSLHHILSLHHERTRTQKQKATTTRTTPEGDSPEAQHLGSTPPAARRHTSHHNRSKEIQSGSDS